MTPGTHQPDRMGPENGARVQQWLGQLDLKDLQFVLCSAAVELLNRQGPSQLGRSMNTPTAESDQVVVCFAAGPTANELGHVYDLFKSTVVDRMMREDQG